MMKWIPVSQLMAASGLTGSEEGDRRGEKLTSTSGVQICKGEG